jgi:hypothetical protein
MTHHKLIFHNDPGHGWVAVRRTLIQRLGVVPTPYSFQRGATVYLEEDCDAGALIRALKDAGETYELLDRCVNHSSRIRGYTRYHHEPGLLERARSIIDREPSGKTDPWSDDCRQFARAVIDHLT